MKTVEIRRHSLRDPPDLSLSPAGIRLARRVRADLPRFDLAISSPALRAVQTALELGYAHPRLEPLWAELGAAVSDELPWPTSFPLAREAVGRAGSAARTKSRELWSALNEYLQGVPDGGALLVVTHGGFPELVVAGARAPSGPADGAGPIRCLEGVRLEVAGGRVVAASLLRLADHLTRV